MSLDTIWAGWRATFVGSADASVEDADDVEACVFCRILNSGLPDPEAMIVWRGEQCVCLLNAYPYTSGHAMVMPIRHVGDIGELTEAEHLEMWRATNDLVVALRGAYSPGGINIGANLGRVAGAGVPGHFHFHGLPRWGGDTNFMTTIAAARVLPESLTDTYDKLVAAWPTT